MNYTDTAGLMGVALTRMFSVSIFVSFAFKNVFKLINYNTSIYKNSWSLIILCSLITIFIVSILYRYKKKKKQDMKELKNKVV